MTEKIFLMYITGNLKYLKPYAVPSRKLPESSVKGKSVNVQLKNDRLQRKIIRNSRKPLSTISNQPQTQANTNSSKNLPMEVGHDHEAAVLCQSPCVANFSLDDSNLPGQNSKVNLGPEHSLGGSVEYENLPVTEIIRLLKCKSSLDDLDFLNLLSVLEKKCSTAEKKDVGIQVDGLKDHLSASLVDNIKTDAQLSTVTGLENFKLLYCIVRMAGRLSKPLNYNSKLNLRERIIMTYCKLKQNISYSFLAVLFNFSCSSTCQKIFIETVQLLSAVLEIFIDWPDRDETRRNLPKCFENFLDVAVVLDCTEIFIQHPSNLTQQIVTYSTYKHDNTLKIMTGVSPAGNIIWISDIYGSRVSDKAIFEKSNLISKYLVPGDAVMVDRGFLIDEVCDLNRIKLIRPPFLGDRVKFTKEEAN